jgi:proteasome assembly chaperone (PAC2) family protein
MNFLTREKVEMTEPVKIYFRPELENASMIACWQESMGGLGKKVVEYLQKHIQAKNFCDIEPVKFFPLGGVSVVDNVVRFPQSKFWAGARRDLFLLDTNQPKEDLYTFLNTVLDVGQHYCHMKDVFTVNASVSGVAHSSPRKLNVAFNRSDAQARLRGYGLENVNFEGSPALDSYLLWLAARRDITAVSLWPQVSYYLANVDDPWAARAVLSFLDRYFDLGMDLSGLDHEIELQNEKLNRLRAEEPQVDKFIRSTEMGVEISQEEQVSLVKAVTGFIEKASD